MLTQLSLGVRNAIETEKSTLFVFAVVVWEVVGEMVGDEGIVMFRNDKLYFDKMPLKRKRTK